MSGKVKKILIGILILAVSGGAIGYYLWNKPPTDIAGKKPDFTLSATDLFNSFSSDSANAKKYIGDEKNNKVVQVSGEVAEVILTDSSTNVFLKADTSGSTINCAFLSKQQNLKKGDNVNIKGMVSGFLEYDADLEIPGNVVMDRCVLVK